MMMIKASSRPLVAFLLSAILLSARAKTVLNPVSIYGSEQNAKACLTLTWSVATTFLSNSVNRAAPNCLRMSFHDAGTYVKATDQGGANGSVMKELDFAAFPQNSGLEACPAAIERIMLEVRRKVYGDTCKGLTYADAIQVAGAVAVASLSGPTCKLLMGRPDKGSADSTATLPGLCDSATTQIATFTNMGFSDPQAALVVLSGAHNVGSSRVADSSTCPNGARGSKGLGPMTSSPTAFDGHFYTEVVQRSGKQGWFFSDRALSNATSGATAAMTARMSLYSGSHAAFLGKWCAFYREMGLLGVDPAPAGLSVADGWSPVASGAAR